MVKAAIFVLAAITLGFALGPLTTTGYNLTGARWDHTAITHDGTPELSAAIDMWAAVGGITNGGYSENPDITADVRPIPSAGYASWSTDNSREFIHHCHVTVDSDFVTWMMIWVHEAGHCLGIAHACESGEQGCTLAEKLAIMEWTGGSFGGINEDDIAAAVALYGPKLPDVPPTPATYRLVAPLAVKE